MIFWGSIGFTPAARQQAIRRLLRYGQEKEVIAYDVYAKNTVEDGIRNIHTVKEAVTSAIVDRDSGPLNVVTNERLLRIVDCLQQVDEVTGKIFVSKETGVDATEEATTDTDARA